MDINLFDYYLPEELIAQRPAEHRDGSRLLVYDRSGDRVEHKHFFDIADYIEAGDILVLNDSKVIHARLIGTKASTGARIEVFLVRKAVVADVAHVAGFSRENSEVWEALVKPSKRVKQGDTVMFSDELRAELVGDADDGGRLVRFTYERCNNKHEGNRLVCEHNGNGSSCAPLEHNGYVNRSGSSCATFDEIIERLGRTPLPPYIRREADKTDDERYQTVYSKNPGSVAAPTAGLHFTDELLDKIRGKGAEIVFVTLHVGLGTFRPVKTDAIEDHHMHTEEYHIPRATADAINRAKSEGRRVVCVGTTSVRTLESAAEEADWTPIIHNRNLPFCADEKSHPICEEGDRYHVCAGQGETDIFIYPSYEFKIADALITNFHLPKSTLLMLVSALAGRERILSVYKEAVRERYRFFSYGDAMFIY